MAQTLDYDNNSYSSLYKLAHPSPKKTIKIANRHLFVTSKGSLEQLHADENTPWIEEVNIESGTITYRIIDNPALGDPLSK